MSFDILKKETEIFGDYFLQASAGTGKTFSIEHLVVRLLLEAKDVLTIDQILVVTFTNKACNELKTRIRSNLEKALYVLKTPSNDEENIFEYLAVYKEEEKRLEAISKLEEAIDLFETSKIFTIHSFCLRSLKEHAFEADVDLSIEDDNGLEKQKKHVFDFLKFHLKEENYLPEQIEILIKKYKDVKKLSQKLINFVDIKNEHCKMCFTAKGFFENFQKELKTFEHTNLENIIFEFEQISKSFKKAKFKNDDFISQIKLLILAIKNRKCDLEDFRFFLKTKLSIFEFLDNKNKKLRSKDFEIPNILKDAKAVLYPIIKEASDSNNIFFRLAFDVSKYVDANFEKEESLTFDNILTKMQKALSFDSFKGKIKKKYRAVVIDEFQDTDKIQWDIFKNLFFENQKTLAFYLIGDPKQSIYSFRNADLYTYLEASKKINNTKRLDTNYRSSPSLVSSINALFDKSFANDWLKLPRYNDSLSYTPIKAGLKDDFSFDDTYAPVHFFIAEDESKLKKWPTDLIEKKYFSYMAAEILKLKKTHGFTFSSFAVLVKDRFQAQRLKSYLNKSSIKSVTSKATTLKNSKALMALQVFFEAVLHPRNLSIVKRALLGPYVKLSENKIKEIDLEEKTSPLKVFYYLKNLILKKGIGFFFNSFFYEKLFDEISVLERLASKSDLSFFHETMYLIELLINEKNLNVDKISSFFKTLSSLESDSEKLQIKSSNEDGVQILTTFLSKGLEYDIVFALGSAFRAIDKLKDNFDEIDAEKMRVFYVALTRAKYRVYIPVALDKKEKKIEKGTCSLVEGFLCEALNVKDAILKKEDLLKALDPLKDQNHISYNFIENLETPLICKANDDIALKKPIDFTNHYPSNHILSFSNLNLDYKISENRNDKNLPSSSEMGILFHSIFEKIFKSKSFKNVDSIINEEVKKSLFIDYISKISKIINETLNLPLFQNQFDFEKAKVELEFLYPIEKKLMKGFIDLVFLSENKYYILDWKSNFLGNVKNDYENENLKKVMKDNNYFMQAAIYTESLKRYLENVLKQDFEKSFGGVYYIFLRGIEFREGVLNFYPDLKILKNIDKYYVETI